MKNLYKHFKPIYLVILINIIGFFLLYLYRQPNDQAAVFAGIAVIALICTAYALILKLALGDGYLFLIVSMLVSLGIIMLYRLNKDLAVKQILWLALGTAMFFLCYFIYTRFAKWEMLMYFYLGGSFVLFALTMALAKNIKGAKNWIFIGDFSIQASEIIKVLYVLFTASYYSNSEKLQISGLKLMGRDICINHRLVFIAISYCYIGFLVLQKELGTAFLLFVVFFLFLFISGSSILIMVINACFASAGALLGYLLMSHIKVRVDIWLNPWADISNRGYQIVQSLFAIGAGGFFGTGLGLGRPDLIPEVYSDFIFSAICEEMGIFGGIAVIFLFFIFVYRGVKISLIAKEPFDKNVALGITLMFGLQTFIILGGVTKLIPLTGITLPFISYGGSSLVSGFVALGILQAISNKY